MKIFSEVELSTRLNFYLQSIRNDIFQRDENYILNVNEQEFIEHIIEKARIEPLSINFDSIEVSDHERSIPAENFPDYGFHVRSGQRYTKTVYVFHLPFSGSDELLRMMPSARILWTADVDVINNEISFEIIDFSNGPDAAKQEANHIIDNIKMQLSHVVAEIDGFNQRLPEFIKTTFQNRKQQILLQKKNVQSLGFRVRQAADVPKSFAVPVTRKKIFIKPEPQANPAASPLSPVLDVSIYDAMLQVIHDTGKVFERLPSVYANKDEEALRDQLILNLEPHFEGSTTGETFNKKGKTDILIRHEKSNIFVAECKFWAGQSKYHETINQLLSYLTWRDSKSAVIMFVRNKAMMPVLKEIQEGTSKHPCFLKLVSKKNESWQNFEFHLPDDKDCKLKVAVLAFHLPAE